MRDMHSHILPGVDDGASCVEESLAMLKTAAQIGVTSIVCTPHCRAPYFDFEAMWKAFFTLADAAEAAGLAQEGQAGRPVSTPIALQMGFEVNYLTLMNLGLDWIDLLAFDEQTRTPESPEGKREFLLELPEYEPERNFSRYQRVISLIQERGYEVIIAHPERIRMIGKNIEYAFELARMGCKLQLSADYLKGGRLGTSEKPARELLRSGLDLYLASDAHYEEHYLLLAQALRETKKL